jgi:hypothetical protein
MNPIDYMHWFKCETWTLEQAAYLCHGIDPNDENTTDSLNSFVERSQYIDPFKTTPTPIILTSIKKTIQVLEAINWEGNRNRIPVIQLIDIIEEKKLDESESILEEWNAHINKHGDPSSQVPEENSNNSPPFITLNSLGYDEITVTFLEGDAIELLARKIKKAFSYEALGLRDKRKGGEVTLNAAGRMLVEFRSPTPPKVNDKNGKHKAELKKVINSWFGLSGDPFRVIGISPSTRYETKFSVKEDTRRSSNRIKSNSMHQSLDGIETQNFDVEDDPAGEFLNENGE